MFVHTNLPQPCTLPSPQKQLKQLKGQSAIIPQLPVTYNTVGLYKLEGQKFISQQYVASFPAPCPASTGVLAPRRNIKNVAHISLVVQWCCLGNRLYIPPWGVVLHIGVRLCLTPMCNTTPQGEIYLKVKQLLGIHDNYCISNSISWWKLHIQPN